MTTQDDKVKIAQRIHADTYAPLYHFIAPEGNALPFDPNGALFWKGKYHLFYIFQDLSLPYGGHCWGHASSTDLLHWTFHPTALSPSAGSPDKGIFSGNAFISKEGTPTLAYFGIDAGICLAQSKDDDLRFWTKLRENPVIPMPEKDDPGWGVYNVFDPHIWLEDDTYFAILGGNVKPLDEYDTAYLFKSNDLIKWQYVNPFYTPKPNWTDLVEDCACPDFFKLGDRYMLLCISHSHGTRYYLGSKQDGIFIPEEHHRMNWPGGSCFAPESLIDDQSRRIFWAWVPDQRRGDNIVKNELGVMTLPRVLSTDTKGKLLINPPAEITRLRSNNRSMKSLVIPSQHNLVLDGIEGNCLELELKITVPKDGIFGLKVCMSPDSEEQTVITVDTVTQTLSINTSQTSLRTDIFQPFPIMRGKPRMDTRIQTASLKLEPDVPLLLRIFIDKSILEVFANGRQCITQRIYPTRSDSLQVALFSKQGKVPVKEVQAWDMVATNLYPDIGLQA